uniref:Uncharacterized protein n=1 Tax=Lactuca sativa TaxID=4236 RepID=A0A9R1WMS8_LACSA|nr:hypothetical protein LSAT_V11C100049460 [Lactuca sativa]
MSWSVAVLTPQLAASSYAMEVAFLAFWYISIIFPSVFVLGYGQPFFYVSGKVCSSPKESEANSPIDQEEFIKNRSKDPKANLFKPPNDYLFIKKEDWKVFVSHRVTKKRKVRKLKNNRAHHQYNHRLSIKGYVRLINDITEEEIDRTLLWKKARELKIGGYKSDVKMIVDKIDELQKSGSFGEVTCRIHDVLAEALGT